jgi:hypothetical protein
MNSLNLKGLKIIRPNKMQSKKIVEGRYIKELMPNNNPILKIIPDAILALYNLNTLIKHQIIIVLANSGADK